MQQHISYQYMINSDELRGMIQRGRVPEHSRILYGSSLWTLRNTWAGMALIPLIWGTISIISAIFWMSDVSPLSIDFIIAHVLMYADFVALLLGGIISPLIVALKARKSALIFLPDGCMNFDNIHSNNPAKRKVLNYAAISDLQLNLSFWQGPHLMVRDYAGKNWRWDADACYGPRGRALQDILIAYNTYTVRNNMAYKYVQ